MRETVLNYEITAIVNIIHQAVSRDRIYLFGSQAEGRTHEDSDLDFYAVLPYSSGHPIEACPLPSADHTCRLGLIN